jgi:hypothetical protein
MQQQNLYDYICNLKWSTHDWYSRHAIVTCGQLPRGGTVLLLPTACQCDATKHHYVASRIA